MSGQVCEQGVRLQSARRETGLSYAAFARELGISKSSLSRYETGELPLPRKIELALIGLRASREV
jgi:transcriptional regulator with XRE-family HTH domain